MRLQAGIGLNIYMENYIYIYIYKEIKTKIMTENPTFTLLKINKHPVQNSGHTNQTKKLI